MSVEREARRGEAFSGMVWCRLGLIGLVARDLLENQGIFHRINTNEGAVEMEKWLLHELELGKCDTRRLAGHLRGAMNGWMVWVTAQGWLRATNRRSRPGRGDQSMARMIS